MSTDVFGISVEEVVGVAGGVVAAAIHEQEEKEDNKEPRQR